MQKFILLAFLALFCCCHANHPPKIQMLDSDGIMLYWAAWAATHQDTTRLRTFQDSMARAVAVLEAKPLLSDSMDAAFRKAHVGESAVLILKDPKGGYDHYYFYRWFENQGDSVQIWFQADNKVHVTYHAGTRVPEHQMIEVEPGWYRANGDIVTIHAPEESSSKKQ